AVAAPRAGPAAVIPAPEADVGPGQVVDAGDALGGIGAVFAGSWHGGTPGRGDLPGIRPAVATCSQGGQVSSLTRFGWPGLRRRTPGHRALDSGRALRLPPGRSAPIESGYSFAGRGLPR